MWTLTRREEQLLPGIARAGPGVVHEKDLGPLEVWWMHKHLTCTCGHVIHADSDDEMVRNAQEHMKTVHGKTISREDVLTMAKEAKH